MLIFVDRRLHNRYYRRSHNLGDTRLHRSVRTSVLDNIDRLSYLELLWNDCDDPQNLLLDIGLSGRLFLTTICKVCDAFVR